MDKIKNSTIYLGFIYSTIFGFSFMFTKMTLNHVYNGYHLLAFRFLVAFLIMSVLLILGVININFKGKRLKILIALGIFQPIVYFIFETKGLALVPSSQAGIMIANVPIVVTIFASIFLNEKTTLKEVLFISLSILGVIIINANNFGIGDIKGTFYLSIAVFAAAGYNILSRKVSLQFTSIEITYIMMGFGAVVFNTLSIITHLEKGIIKHYFNPLTNFNAIIGFTYLGVLSSVVAFFVLNHALSQIEASKIAVFANFTTVVAVLAGIIILGEDFKWFQIIGCLMILTGVYGTQKT